MNLMFQAKLDMGSWQQVIAAAHREDFVHYIECCSHRLGIVIRSEITRPVAHQVPRPEDAREGFVGDPDEGIFLVVLEVDVIAWAMGLDVGALENERFLVAFGDDVVDVVNLRDQGRQLGPAVIPRSLAEIGAHTAAQILGFADIDYPALLVLHQIDSRSCRQ